MNAKVPINIVSMFILLFAMLSVWVSASTDSKSPVPIHATSRSVHSHSIGRAVKFSGYRYIVFLPKVKPQVCACDFCLHLSSPLSAESAP